MTTAVGKCHEHWRATGASASASSPGHPAAQIARCALSVISLGAPRGLFLCRIVIAAHSGLAKGSGLPEFDKRGGLAQVIGDQGEHGFGAG